MHAIENELPDAPGDRQRQAGSRSTRANLISFQIRIGTVPDGNKLGIAARDIDDRDVPRANLVLGQLRERNLPIPAAVFAERLVRVPAAMRKEGRGAGAAR